MPPASAAPRPRARTRTRPAPHPRRISGPIARPIPAVTLPAPRRGSTGAFERLRALPDHRMVDRLLRVGGRLAAISFHSLEDRRVKRFLADRTRGCICPPDLPVCGCGRTPEAALVFRRSIAASAGEAAANPRSKSARLRAARKLAEEH